MSLGTILDSYNLRCAVHKYSVFSISGTEFFFRAEEGFYSEGNLCFKIGWAYFASQK